MGSPPIPTTTRWPSPARLSSAMASYVSVPLRLTMATLPGVAIWPGIIPSRLPPGTSTPGQLGPISWLLLPANCWRTASISCTGTPSVIHTISGISASIASHIAAAAWAGGTKITLASTGPWAAVRSRIVLYTGGPCTLCPCLPGEVPATSGVP